MLLTWVDWITGNRRVRRLIDGLVLLVPIALYLYGTLGLTDWLIDDAGISFAYARNLAGGYGLVSQPGMEPVEGFSNFLWILVMTPLFWLHLFDPLISSKTISFVFVIVTFFMIHRMLVRDLDVGRILSFVALTLLSLNTSFVVWTCSGLENPLFAFLIVAFFAITVRFVTADKPKAGEGALIGLLAVALALTRPDGIVYCAVFPAAVVLRLIELSSGQWRGLMRSTGGYILAFAAAFGGFMLFRLSYYGQWLPNTYYAKGGIKTSDILPVLLLQGSYLDKFRDLCGSVFGQRLWLVVPAFFLVVFSTVLWRRDRWRAYCILLAMTGLSVFVYLIMPIDWMGEYRFATPFFVLFVICMATASGLLSEFPRKRTVRTAVAIGLILCTLVATYHEHQPRLERFSQRKVVNFAGIANRYARRFNRFADQLELNNASFLVPDIGGPLYYSKLRIYDLSGLCDRTIARSRGKDQQRFYNYVFDTLQPTFIHTHGYFTAVSEFDDDPRFIGDYVAMHDYVDEYVERKYKARRISGDFVRREAVAGKETALESIRQTYDRTN